MTRAASIIGLVFITGLAASAFIAWYVGKPFDARPALSALIGAIGFHLLDEELK